MSTSKPQPTPEQRALRDIASEIVAKACRLRNKADLVRQDMGPGRNLTALRNTIRDLKTLFERLDKWDAPERNWPGLPVKE